MPKIPEYPALTAPDDADLLVIEDTIAGNTKQITREDFLTGSPLPADTVDEQAVQDGAITEDKIDDGAVAPDKLATGALSAFNQSSGTTSSGTLTSTLGGTPGTNPSVTVTIGANGLALVTWGFRVSGSTAMLPTVSFHASGANTINDTGVTSIPDAVRAPATSSGVSFRYTGSALLTGLNPGSTTFFLVYATDTGTATFSDRKIGVVPL